MSHGCLGFLQEPIVQASILRKSSIGGGWYRTGKIDACMHSGLLQNTPGTHAIKDLELLDAISLYKVNCWLGATYALLIGLLLQSRINDCTVVVLHGLLWIMNKKHVSSVLPPGQNKIPQKSFYFVFFWPGGKTDMLLFDPQQPISYGYAMAAIHTLLTKKEYIIL